MKSTVVVQVERKVPHSLYKKYITKTKKYYAHDPKNSCKVGDVVKVPVGVKHRVENREEEDLKFIEVQVGTYFGEDDIVRLNDRYGRA